jgi:hypothetical protein
VQSFAPPSPPTCSIGQRSCVVSDGGLLQHVLRGLCARARRDETKVCTHTISDSNDANGALENAEILLYSLSVQPPSNDHGRRQRSTGESSSSGVNITYGCFCPNHSERHKYSCHVVVSGTYTINKFTGLGIIEVSLKWRAL